MIQTLKESRENERSTKISKIQIESLHIYNHGESRDPHGRNDVVARGSHCRVILAIKHAIIN